MIFMHESYIPAPGGVGFNLVDFNYVANNRNSIKLPLRRTLRGSNLHCAISSPVLSSGFWLNEYVPSFACFALLCDLCVQKSAAKNAK
jgi:hypothetical protein